MIGTLCPVYEIFVHSKIIKVFVVFLLKALFYLSPLHLQFLWCEVGITIHSGHGIGQALFFKETSFLTALQCHLCAFDRNDGEYRPSVRCRDSNSCSKSQEKEIIFQEVGILILLLLPGYQEFVFWRMKRGQRTLNYPMTLMTASG